jgi:hypothetical protein
MNDAEEHLMTVFSAALELGSAAERQAYLDRACAGDPALRQRVEALLRALDRAGGFLGRVPGPAETAGAEPLEGTGPADVPQAGAVIVGRYKLLERIGEGGMGDVWMAEQTRPVRRKVALKLIKAGMDSRRVLARFEAERQALALMDHANIARVLDAGTTGDVAGGGWREKRKMRLSLPPPATHHPAPHWETWRLEGGGWREKSETKFPLPPPATHHPPLRAGRSSSWSWSRAPPSQRTATTTSLPPESGWRCSGRSARRCSTPTRRG